MSIASPKINKLVRPLLCTASALLLVSCSTSDGPRSDAEQVTQALLKTLTSQGKPICFDSATRGEPLAIFRTMLPAPDPARRPLAWREPTPHRPGQNVTGGQLIAAEYQDEKLVLPEFAPGETTLPVIMQLRLNALAQEIAFLPGDSTVTLQGGPDVPNARVRWWLFNRFDRSCGPVYTLSKPIVFRDAAFVSVMSAHEGNTYALRRVNTIWTPIAKWSNWLY